MSIGTYTLDASSTVSLSSIADGYVVADAVRLVATTPPAPTGSTIYYSHNDHLGTPQAFTDQNQSVVWQADYQPFGEVNETINTFVNNLRFPGQYYDAETGQHYNYFRDYDPTTGRYIQSDPIGLQGGLNTYGYALQNPLRYTDPAGEVAVVTVVVIVGGVTLTLYIANDIICKCKEKYGTSSPAGLRVF